MGTHTGKQTGVHVCACTHTNVTSTLTPLNIHPQDHHFTTITSPGSPLHNYHLPRITTSQLSPPKDHHFTTITSPGSPLHNYHLPRIPASQLSPPKDPRFTTITSQGSPLHNYHLPRITTSQLSPPQDHHFTTTTSHIVVSCTTTTTVHKLSTIRD